MLTIIRCPLSGRSMICCFRHFSARIPPPSPPPNPVQTLTAIIAVLFSLAVRVPALISPSNDEQPAYFY
jgi:hypothetical protein